MLSHMAGICVGEGHLAGQGVYAVRVFAEGEVVVPYELTALTRGEFLGLSEDERAAVHSYWGRRYLYPSPARYVNHSDSPNMYQDFERHCDVAIRPIAAGELLTIDAHQETDRELATFLEAGSAAFLAGDLATLGELLDEDVLLFSRGRTRTRGEVLDSLHRVHREKPCGGGLILRNVKWMIGTGRWEAVCSADYEASDVEGSSDGHLTALLKVIDGNWQVIYAHTSTT